MRFKKISMLTALLLFVFNMSVSYAAQSPTVMVQQVANRMIAQLKKNEPRLKRNPSIVHEIVNQVLIPHIDVNRMAAAVVGRYHWTKASSTLQKSFIYEFKKLVTNTYADALASYNGDIVKVYPLRGNAANNKQVVVNSVIIRKSGQKVAIRYNLTKIGSQWKVYDFSIENVSIVQSYRSQFSNTLARGGLAYLVQRLRKYNRS